MDISATIKGMKAKGKDCTVEAKLSDDGKQVLFTGGKKGVHRILVATNSAEGVRAHWRGYAWSNGACRCLEPAKVAERHAHGCPLSHWNEETAVARAGAAKPGLPFDPAAVLPTEEGTRGPVFHV